MTDEITTTLTNLANAIRRITGKTNLMTIPNMVVEMNDYADKAPPNGIGLTVLDFGRDFVRTDSVPDDEEILSNSLDVYVPGVQVTNIPMGARFMIAALNSHIEPTGRIHGTDEILIAPGTHGTIGCNVFDTDSMEETTHSVEYTVSENNALSILHPPACGTDGIGKYILYILIGDTEYMASLCYHSQLPGSGNGTGTDEPSENIIDYNEAFIPADDDSDELPAVEIHTHDIKIKNVPTGMLLQFFKTYDNDDLIGRAYEHGSDFAPTTPGTKGNIECWWGVPGTSEWSEDNTHSVPYSISDDGTLSIQHLPIDGEPDTDAYYYLAFFDAADSTAPLGTVILHYTSNGSSPEQPVVDDTPDYERDAMVVEGEDEMGALMGAFSNVVNYSSEYIRVRNVPDGAELYTMLLSENDLMGLETMNVTDVHQANVSTNLGWGTSGSCTCSSFDGEKHRVDYDVSDNGLLTIYHRAEGNLRFAVLMFSVGDERTIMALAHVASAPEVPYGLPVIFDSRKFTLLDIAQDLYPALAQDVGEGNVENYDAQVLLLRTEGFTSHNYSLSLVGQSYLNNDLHMYMCVYNRSTDNYNITAMNLQGYERCSIVRESGDDSMYRVTCEDSFTYSYYPPYVAIVMFSKNIGSAYTLLTDTEGLRFSEYITDGNICPTTKTFQKNNIRYFQTGLNTGIASYGQNMYDMLESYLVDMSLPEEERYLDPTSTTSVETAIVSYPFKGMFSTWTRPVVNTRDLIGAGSVTGRCPRQGNFTVRVPVEAISNLSNGEYSTTIQCLGAVNSIYMRLGQDTQSIYLRDALSAPAEHDASNLNQVAYPYEGINIKYVSPDSEEYKWIKSKTSEEYGNAGDYEVRRYYIAEFIVPITPDVTEIELTEYGTAYATYYLI